MLPTIAFAATASFSGTSPKSGSTVSAVRPTITTIVYDRYGVSGSANYRISLDGVRRATSISRWSGYGLKKFRLSYTPTFDLSTGEHDAYVRVKDLKGNVSILRWSFTVANTDNVAPVTTSDVALNYIGVASITLTARDNVAVEETHYILDGGAELLYTPGSEIIVQGDALPEAHTLEYWSEDAAGNEEAHHIATFFVTKTFAMNHALPTDEANALCVTSACHGTDLSAPRELPGDLASIHRDLGCAPCHAGDATPLNSCVTCHGPNGPHGETHIAILSTSTDPSACTVSTCHGSNAMTIHENCLQCHGSDKTLVQSVIAAGMADPAVLATCESCHTDGFTTVHAPGNAPHTVPASNTCVTPVCHTSANAVTIHAGTDNGCATCHNGVIDLDATPLSSCTWSSCHPTGLLEHDILPAAHITENTCASGNAAACHPSNVATLHVTRPVGSSVAIPGCAACHAVGTTPSTDCATCHPEGMGAHIPAVVAGAATSHTATMDSSCIQATNCHGTRDVTVIHTAWVRSPGCIACHAEGVNASTVCVTCHPNGHDTQNAAHASPLAEACADCHAQNLETEHFTYGIGCVACHASTDARVKAAFLAGDTACVACHFGTGTNPNLKPGHASEFTAPTNASGHNVPGISSGALTRFDGGEGSNGVVVKSSTGATITQEWPLPTASVFWSQSKALNMDGTVNTSGVYSLNPTDAPAVAMANRGGTNMAAAIDTEMGWDSVVLCTDCHDAAAGIQATGPHGSTQNWAVDSNFPDDWTKAEITSFDPTGMRSIETTRGSGNPYYPELGSNVYMPMEVINGDLSDAPSIETTVQKKYGAGMPDQTTTITVKPGGFYAETNQTGTGYSSATKTGRFICQKCHKLANSFQGLAIEGNGRGFRDNNYNYIGMSNEAHMEHHNDLTTGQGNCVSCHIAIPHGWKRPRLLVYESDPAPYKVQYIWPNYRTTDLTLLSTANPDLSAGNWGWLNKAPNGNALTLNSRYQDVTATNAYTGGLNSTHIEKIDASTTALKELEIGIPPLEYDVYDAFNGTAWGKWLPTAQGVIWPGNPIPEAAHINLTVWDAETQLPVIEVGGEAPIQNNCNACTSASAGTHAPQVGPGGSPTSLANEGVNAGLPYWK